MNPVQNDFLNNPSTALIYLAISLWSLAWKGLAIWRAGRLQERNWFIVILVINLLGILEILYLFRFSKNRLTIAEMKSWFGR